MGELDLLWNFVNWNVTEKNAKVMTQFGPFTLGDGNAPYLGAFLRTTERAVFHASNVLRNFVADIDLATSVWTRHGVPADAIVHTGDSRSKYEVEAFLNAIVTATEDDLIGKENSRLRWSPGLAPPIAAQLRAFAINLRQKGINDKWRYARNHAVHLTGRHNDWKREAVIRNFAYKPEIQLGAAFIGKKAPVKNSSGKPMDAEFWFTQSEYIGDLADVFLDAFDTYLTYVNEVKYVLTNYVFTFIAVPQNRFFSGMIDPLGNMNRCLGPDGYESRYFPQTAKTFVGPLPG